MTQNYTNLGSLSDWGMRFSVSQQSVAPSSEVKMNSVAQIHEINGSYYAFSWASSDHSSTGQVEIYRFDPETEDGWECITDIPKMLLNEAFWDGIGDDLPDTPTKEAEKEYSNVWKWRGEYYSATDDGVYVFLESSKSWILAPSCRADDFKRSDLYVSCREESAPDGLNPDPTSNYNEYLEL